MGVEGQHVLRCGGVGRGDALVESSTGHGLDAWLVLRDGGSKIVGEVVAEALSLAGWEVEVAAVCSSDDGARGISTCGTAGDIGIVNELLERRGGTDVDVVVGDLAISSSLMTISSRMNESVRERGLIRLCRALDLIAAEIAAGKAILHDGVQTWGGDFALYRTWCGFLLSWSWGVWHRPVLRGAVAGCVDIRIDARMHRICHEAQDVLLLVAIAKQVDDFNSGVDLDLLDDFYRESQIKATTNIRATQTHLQSFVAARLHSRPTHWYAYASRQYRRPAR